jgi:hypothetical protein
MGKRGKWDAAVNASVGRICQPFIYKCQFGDFLLNLERAIANSGHFVSIFEKLI